MQFLFYCFCGGIGVTTDYLVYYVAITYGVWYQSANVLGYLSGTLVSFFLNRRITFNVRDKLSYRLAIFLGVAAIGFSASVAMLWFLIEILAIDARIAKLVTLPMVVIIQFSMNKRITFSKNMSEKTT